MMEPATGWARDNEDVDYLHNAGVAYSLPSQFLFGVPEEFITDDIITTENQVQVSSCTGHGESSGLEACYYIASVADGTERPKQFSRMFAYLVGQKHCGMYGRDQGATIKGVVEGSKVDGCCLEKTHPYPGRYVTKFPDGAYAEAAKYRIRSHSNLRSYEEVMAYQQAGHGPIVIGITWTSALANSNGIIRLADTRGRGGGHCVLLWGWDKSGRVRLHNSHGTQWGDSGRAWVEPDAIRQWCGERYSELIGISDLSGVDVQRPVVNFTDIV